MCALTISVPQPCSESWQHMVPAPGGRHCATCQKVVVDFTQKTDAELLAYFQQPDGNSCGQFKASQLNRTLLAPDRSSTATGVLVHNRVPYGPAGSWWKVRRLLSRRP